MHMKLETFNNVLFHLLSRRGQLLLHAKVRMPLVYFSQKIFADTFMNAFVPHKNQCMVSVRNLLWALRILWDFPTEWEDESQDSNMLPALDLPSWSWDHLDIEMYWYCHVTCAWSLYSRKGWTKWTFQAMPHQLLAGSFFPARWHTWFCKKNLLDLWYLSG